MKLALAMLATGCSITGASFTPGPSGTGTGNDDDAAPSTPITIRVHDRTIVGEPVNAQLVGVRDGDGPWTPLIGTVGVYQASVRSDRVSVVVGCIDAPFRTIDIREQLVREGTTLDMVSCRGGTETGFVTVSGTLANLGTPPSAQGLVSGPISVGGASAAGTYSFGTQRGTTELLASSSLDGIPGGFLRKTGLDIQTPQDVSFDFAGAMTLDVDLITSTTAGNDPTVYSSLSTRTGTYSLPTVTSPLLPGPRYAAIPTAALLSGELVEVGLQDAAQRNTLKLTNGTTALQMELATALIVAVPTIETSNGVIPTWTVPEASQATLPLVSYDLSATTFDSTQHQLTIWAVHFSDAWAIATGATTYTAPILHDMTGYDPATFDLAPHLSVGLMTSRNEQTTLERVDGREIRTASQVDTVTNP